MPSQAMGHAQRDLQQLQAGTVRQRFTSTFDLFPPLTINTIDHWTQQIMPQLSSLTALNMENLEGDYYVPGNELDSGDGIWREIQAQGCPKKSSSIVNCFGLMSMFTFCGILPSPDCDE